MKTTILSREEITATPETIVCESCLETARSEYLEMLGFEPEGLDETARDICLMLGEEIRDHYCEEIDEPGARPCACTCH